jgi:REP element-mobilizing transposase RayT
VTYYHRNLPHWQPPHQDIFLTWRLKGSLPRHLHGISPASDPGKRFLALDQELDRAAEGPLWLGQPLIAECLVTAFRKLEDQRLARVHAYAIMANHVHILIGPTSPVEKITRMVKGTTARQANLLLSLTGNIFWQDESFDHWVRNPGEWQKIRTYIERNPVAAGLVEKPEDWPWSSASNPL